MPAVTFEFFGYSRLDRLLCERLQLLQGPGPWVFGGGTLGETGATQLVSPSLQLFHVQLDRWEAFHFMLDTQRTMRITVHGDDVDLVFQLAGKLIVG